RLEKYRNGNTGQSSTAPFGRPFRHRNCMRNYVGMASTAHRISTHPSEHTIRVELNGEVLAESTRATALEETGLPTRYYLPREDVRMDLLTATDTTSHCPFKGDASYF